jgi:hypothetical protein
MIDQALQCAADGHYERVRRAQIRMQSGVRAILAAGAFVAVITVQLKKSEAAVGRKKLPARTGHPEGPQPMDY